jgi:ArsR family transcriptional regulator
MNEQEICVCEFCKVLNFIQPKISRHLSYLRKSGLILDERREQWVYYKLNNNLQMWIKKILTTISNELKPTQPFKEDYEKINKIRKKIHANIKF